MAKTKISEFNANPALNTDIDSINLAEGCAPSGINDAIRELMAQLKDWQSGTSNDPYVVGSSGSLTLNQGTANGVAYLNGSKVVTSGSALTFDGTNLSIPTGNLRIGTSTSSGPYQIFYNASNDAYGTLQMTSTGFQMSADFSSTGGYKPLLFYTNGSEQMRLTSTGLGIGTSSPSVKLDVQGSGRFKGFDSGYYNENVIAIGNASFNPKLGMASNNGYRWNTRINDVGGAGEYIIRYEEGSLDTLTINRSGNLGLGVTPSAWNSSFKSFDIAGGSVFAYSNTEFNLGQNTYFSAGGSFLYKNTGFASRLEQVSGAFKWYTAPSGTAGNAITFTQALTLDASGNLLLGTTSNGSGYRFNVSKGSTGNIAQFTDGVANTFVISTASDTVSIGQANNGPLAFLTNNSERARIDSSGNLLVGTTSSIGSGPSMTLKCPTAGQQCYTSWNATTSGNAYFHEFGTEGTYTARGSITYNRVGGLTAYNTTSDYRAKDISGPVIGSGALIDSTPVYMGKMKGATQERPMFIAHETPSYAHTGEKDAVDADGNPVYQQMDASALIPVMWAEIQSLRKRLADAGL